MANATTLLGDALTAAASPEPSLCRVSGYLIGVNGQPLRGHGITIRHLYKPSGIVASSLVLRERLTIRTDPDGYIEFDLLRGATVAIEIPNFLTDHVMRCIVPDAASANLVDFIYPYVVSVEWVTTDPQALGIDDSIEFELQATLSNGQVCALTSTSTTLTSSDEAVLQKTSGFIFKALAAGSVTVSVEIDTSKLDLLTQPDGTSVNLFEVPEPVLPADLTVTVS